MKDKLQIALLSVIAIALLVIAVGQFTGSGSDEGADIVAAKAAPAATTEPFDPLAKDRAAEPVDDRPRTTITFDKYDHDFGNILQDSENKHVFSFTNTGTEPLLIESANGSCGCTVPEYPKQPIPPGGTGEIVVEYKPGKQENAQNKTVSVIANTEPKQTTLRIKANVQKVG